MKNMSYKEVLDAVGLMATELKNAVEKLKQYDSIQVVRCGHCQYWEPPSKVEVEDGCTMGHCRNDHAPCQNQQTDIDWFCGDAERERE